MKIFFTATTLFCLLSSAVLRGQLLPDALPESFIGMTFDDESEMGFAYYIGGSVLDRDYRPCKWDAEREEFPDISNLRLNLALFSADTEQPWDAAGLHIILIQRNVLYKRPFVVCDELKINRSAGYRYLREEVSYQYEGEFFRDDALVCYDPARDAIRKWYPVDPETRRFIPSDPLPGMRVEWQEP